MKTEFHTVEEILADEGHVSGGNNPNPPRKLNTPIDLSVIPNSMGINLCSVEGLSWTRQDDTQLVSLTIHFIPGK